MKTKNIIPLILLSLLFVRCADEDYVEIDSLQVFGEYFYYGQTVNVGMSVKTSDPDNAYYHWECDGGTLLNRNGYSLNRWQAPRKSGYYKIRCTVSCNGKEQTREAEIFVNGFFFQNFDANEGSNSLPSGWSQEYSTVAIRNNRLELQVNDNSADHGHVRTSFGQSNMRPPFSVKADVGIVGETSASVNNYTPKYPNSDKSNGNTFASRFPNEDNWCAIAITGNTISADTITHFINQVRLKFYPEPDHALSQVKYLPVNASDSVTIAKADFDAMLEIQWTRKANISQGVTQLTATYSIPFKSSLLNYGTEDPRTLGLSVDENYQISVMGNNTEIFSTDALKLFMNSITNENGVTTVGWTAAQFRYYYPTLTRVFLDNVNAYLEANYGGL